MVYNPQHPIDGVFTVVDDLANYAEAAQTPFSQPQCINFAYRILNRAGIFQRWIIDWNARPQVQKTWINFKIHFWRAHQQLIETTNLQAQNTSYHANIPREIVDELSSELQAVKKTVTQAEQVNPPSLTPTSDYSVDSTISALSLEVATLKDYINNIHSTYQAPQNMYPIPPPWIQQYCTPINPYQHFAQQTSSTPMPIQQNQQVQPAQQNNSRKQQIYYCHTHGACFHPGFRCRNKAPGHQDTVPFRIELDDVGWNY